MIVFTTQLFYLKWVMMVKYHKKMPKMKWAQAQRKASSIALDFYEE